MAGKTKKEDIEKEVEKSITPEAVTEWIFLTTFTVKGKIYRRGDKAFLNKEAEARCDKFGVIATQREWDKILKKVRAMNGAKKEDE